MMMTVLAVSIFFSSQINLLNAKAVIMSHRGTSKMVLVFFVQRDECLVELRLDAVQC